jgi:hypothetical protein
MRECTETLAVGLGWESCRHLNAGVRALKLSDWSFRVVESWALENGVRALKLWQLVCGVVGGPVDT